MFYFGIALEMFAFYDLYFSSIYLSFVSLQSEVDLQFFKFY